MEFPKTRLRRLRRTSQLRTMTRRTLLSADRLIQPLFAVHGSNLREEIDILPGNYHLSVDRIGEEAKAIYDAGIPAVLLFGIPRMKEPLGREAYDAEGISQQAIRAVKAAAPELVVIADTCLSMYTETGASGILKDGELLNDPSLELLNKIALVQAGAGADMVAPSAMLDGQVGSIRTALDKEGFENVAIMAYAAKFASQLYDPFFKQGQEKSIDYESKKTCQMDYANSDEAMREIHEDIQEGADVVMVKPAMMYLDIIYRARTEFDVPVAAYHVSGECTMIQAAAQLGRLNEEEIMVEALTAIARAGADMIITYYAKQMAGLLAGK